MLRKAALALTLGVALLAAGADTSASPAATTRVSVASDGTQGNAPSWSRSITSDGRFVAFYSFASNLVPNDTNNSCDYNQDGVFSENCADVFVHDQLTGVTERVSLDSSGGQANNASFVSDMSPDGRFVAFSSSATNLVAGDTNGYGDAFIRDLQTDNTERISLTSTGGQANDNVYPTGMSADGRFVAFHSGASNLVPGDTNGDFDVFVRDRQLGTTERVSITSNGDEANFGGLGGLISDNGRLVAFGSHSTNLAPNLPPLVISRVYVHDRDTGATTMASVNSAGDYGTAYAFDMTADGRFVAFASGSTNLVSGDTNGKIDIFVHDRQTGLTSRVSIDSSGAQGNNDSGGGGIGVSADGRFVSFESLASNMVMNDTNNEGDIFVHDRQTSITTRVSIGGDGSEGNEGSTNPVVTVSGRYVAFTSPASNLVAGDTNNSCDTNNDGVFADNCWDVFVHDLGDTDGDGEWDPFDPCPEIPACGYYHPVTPYRILDTRSGPCPCGKVGAGGILSIDVTGGASGVPATNVSAVVINTTVTEPTAPSHLTVYPSNAPPPLTSNLNFVAGQTVANLVTVKLGADGNIRLQNNSGSTHVIFDVVGWYGGPAGGSRYNPLTPARILDTRTGPQGVPPGTVDAGEIISVDVTGGGGVPASGVTAVIVNATVTGPTAASHLTIYQSDAALPTASNLNFVAGQTVPNLVAVKVGTADGSGGSVKVRNFAGSTHVIFDVVGWYGTSSGDVFTPLLPNRILDTRYATGGFSGKIGTGTPNGQTIAVQATGVAGSGVPATGVTAVIVNTTVTEPTAPSHLTVYTSDAGLPDPASNLNFVAGQTVPNLVVVKVGVADGKVKVYNFSGQTHVIFDVVGYFAPPPP